MSEPRTRSDVLTGSIGKALFVLAGPVILAEALHTLFHIVDVAWVGPLGAWATGAIVTSMFSLWMAFSLVNLVTTGLAAHVSRAIGAGDRKHAGHAVAQALWLCLILSVPVMILGVPGARLLFQILGTDARVSQAGTEYLQIIVLGMPFSFLYLTAGAVMRACGNTMTPMKITASSVAANVVLAPLFIYGPGPFPQLGVPGSAIATVISMAGAVAAYAVLLLRRHPDLPISGPSLRRLDGAMLGSLARVGVPYCLIGMLYSIVYLFYAKIAAHSGDAALAILGIGNRLESITYLTAEGFAVATSTFVGQNLGAKNPARAEQGAWRAMRIMSALGAVIGLAFLVAPGLLLRCFTSDPEALALGVPYLRILAICQIFTGLEGAVGGGFVGAGDTVPPMLIHVGFALVRFPLGAWAGLQLGYGIYGIAWTMSLTCILRGVLLAFWFRRGKWKAKKLPGSLRPFPSPEEPETTMIL